MLTDFNPDLASFDNTVRPAEHLVSDRYAPSEPNSYLNLVKKFNQSTAEQTTHNNTDNTLQSSNTPHSPYSFDSIKMGFEVNIDKFTQKLRSISATTSSARCARSIRLALESAGAKFNGHPVAAADWGNTLMQIGYRKITPAFDQPQEGDIYIINRTAKHRYGHIAGFSGTAWVSDFQQRSHDVYKEQNVTYSYYRLAS